MLRKPKNRSRRSLWIRIPLWIIASLISLVLIVGIVEYAVWRSSDGPSGCVANSYRLVAASSDVDACMRRRITKLLKDKGLVPGLKSLSSMAKRNPILDARCHLPMHSIGQHWARERISNSQFRKIPRVTKFNNVCLKGFMHGYMQGLGADETTTADDLLDFSEGVCARMDSVDRAVCTHGVGHGLARLANNTLKTAAEGCAELSQEDNRDCVKGAVMEIQLTSVKLKDRMKYDTTIGPRKPINCDTLKGAQKSACESRKTGGKLLELSFRAGSS